MMRKIIRNLLKSRHNFLPQQLSKKKSNKNSHKISLLMYLKATMEEN